MKAIKKADAVLLGAVGGPKWTDPNVRPEQVILFSLTFFYFFYLFFIYYHFLHHFYLFHYLFIILLLCIAT